MLNLNDMKPMSTFFISHGAPDIILSDHPALDAMRNISAGMPRPRGVVIVSAHWLDEPIGITRTGSLSTIHDFAGFPDVLYAMQYPAKGSEALSDDIAQRLATNNALKVTYHFRKRMRSDNRTDSINIIYRVF